MTARADVTFTVFTPTFNRRHLLGRVYRSLCAQTFHDFEWIIIDDGSSDDTAALVREWTNDGRLEIQYLYQTNQGKHRAHNRAIELARGRFFAVVDSDDFIVGNALERLLYHWNTIPCSQQHGFSGVTCLCRDETGKIVGRPFPKPVLDCRHFEAVTVYRASGEKWGFHRTAVLRQFPFPEEEEERFCPEALVWNRIGRIFRMRHVNEPLRVYSRQNQGLTSAMSTILACSARLARRYYREYLDLAIPLRYKLKTIVNYVRFSLHADVSTPKLLKEARYSAVSLLLYPLAWLIFMRDCARMARASTPRPC